MVHCVCLSWLNRLAPDNAILAIDKPT